MKKYLMLTLAAGLAAHMVNAQKLTPAQVPAAVKNSFAKDYPNQSVKWEKERDHFEAGFKKNGADFSVLYTPAGKMTESEADIKEAALPNAVREYVKKNMPGKAIKESAKITTAEGVVTYEAEVAGKDLIFDENGKYLKSVKG